MQDHGIHHADDTPPRLTRRQATDPETGEPVTRPVEHVDPETGEVTRTEEPVREWSDENGDVYDKSTNNDHHAEERMQHAAGDDEELIAQAPSQDCCSQCRESLGQPREDGSRPIDEVAPEMRGPRQRGAPVSRREPGE